MSNGQDYGDVARSRGLTDAQGERLRQTRGLTADGLERIPDRALRRALRRLDYPDLPNARESFRRRQSVDETGSVPANALPAALRQLDSIRTRMAAPPRVAGVPTGRSVQPSGLVPPTAGLGGGPATWVAL